MSLLEQERRPGIAEPEAVRRAAHAMGAVLVVDAHPPPGRRWPVALEPILGRSPFQRHLFHLARIGVRTGTVLLVGDGDTRDIEKECVKQIAALPSCPVIVSFRPAREASPLPKSREQLEQVVVVRGSVVCDARLYDALLVSEKTRWIADSSQGGERTSHAVGLARVDVEALPRVVSASYEDAAWEVLVGHALEPGARLDVGDLPTYVPNMRRHLPLFWCDVRTRMAQRRAARLVLDAAQKGILDFPARVLHPVPENLLARGLAGTRITPNQVTILTGVLGFSATYFFATQAFGWGLLLALLVNVLDGVDGKLARITLQMSSGGDRLDHTLDVAFEFSWYAALGWGLSQGSGDMLPLRLGLGLIALMIAARALSGVYKLRTGRQIHDHRAFDRAFRLVAGRRNIYVIVLTVGFIAGHLGEAFVVMFGWGVGTALVYLVRSAMVIGARTA